LKILTRDTIALSNASDQIYMLYGYTKNEQADKDQLKVLKQIVEKC